MSNAIQLNPRMDAIEKVLIQGDLATLNAEQRVSYYRGLCESLGLNPLTKPFDYIVLNKKLTLYAKRDATDQLRKIHNVSVEIIAREKHEDVYVVTARARFPDGRQDESIGAVPIKGLVGETLANAFMKCETKAKRRVTLSICGLAVLDETEADSIPGAKKVDVDVESHGVRPTPVQLEPNSQEPKEIGDYICMFGKYKGQALNDIGAPDVENYIKWIRKESKAKNKPIEGSVAEFVEFGDAYVKHLSSNDGLGNIPF